MSFDTGARPSAMPRQSRSGARLASLVAALLPFSLLSVGCGGGSQVAPPEPAPVAERNQLLTYGNGGITTEEKIVVRDPGELRKWWDLATSRRGQPPALPSVDFESEMVIVVAAGPMDSGSRVEIESVETIQRERVNQSPEDVLKVTVRITDGCGTTESYPVQIVRVPWFDGEVTFEPKTESSTACQDARLGAYPAPLLAQGAL